MITINHTTYTSDGELFAESVTPIKHLWAGTIAATVANRVDRGWRQFSPNQVAKVDHLGFLDVVTYEEMTQ